jgi:hypothetical protein
MWPAIWNSLVFFSESIRFYRICVGYHLLLWFDDEVPVLFQWLMMVGWTRVDCWAITSFTSEICEAACSMTQQCLSILLRPFGLMHWLTLLCVTMRAPEEGEQFHYHSGRPLHKTGSQKMWAPLSQKSMQKVSPICCNTLFLAQKWLVCWWYHPENCRPVGHFPTWDCNVFWARWHNVSYLFATGGLGIILDLSCWMY